MPAVSNPISAALESHRDWTSVSSENRQISTTPVSMSLFMENKAAEVYDITVPNAEVKRVIPRGEQVEIGIFFESFESREIIAVIHGLI